MKKKKSDERKFEMSLVVNLFTADQFGIRKNPKKTLKFALPDIDNYEDADDFLMKSLYAVEPNFNVKSGFTHYIHAYTRHKGLEFEKVPAVFPQGRTFLSEEEADKFMDDFSKYMFNEVKYEIQ